VIFGNCSLGFFSSGAARIFRQIPENFSGKSPDFAILLRGARNSKAKFHSQKSPKACWKEISQFSYGVMIRIFWPG
jgi:hypothetical protein